MPSIMTNFTHAVGDTPTNNTNHNAIDESEFTQPLVLVTGTRSMNTPAISGTRPRSWRIYFTYVNLVDTVILQSM